MKFFQNVSIKRKVGLVILLASMITLLLAIATMFAFQWHYARISIQRDLATQSEIIAANSTAALRFKDKEAGTETLSALKAKPHLLSACLYTPDRKLLAHYGLAADRQDRTASDLPDGFRSEGPHLLMAQPVIENQKRVGTLTLRYDFRAMQIETFKPYLVIFGFVLPASFFTAVLLASVFQRVISQPILALTSTAKVVTDEQDYSVRAEKMGEDELGDLTSTFNQMLARIQGQDATLRAAADRHQRQHEALTTLTRGEAIHGDEVSVTLRRLCEAGARTLRAERASVWRWNEGGTTLRCAELFELTPDRHSEGTELEAARYPNYFQTLATTQFLDAEHAASDPRSAELAADYLKPCGIASMLAVPINLNAQAIGVLCLEQVGPPRPWHADEKMFALSMSNLVSMAFGHWERKQTQAKLDEANRRLIEISRMAGMAEVATGVLHNVGNVLNSVNVSCTLAMDRVRQSKVASLPKLAALLEQQNGRLVEFVTQDPKGRQILGYVCSLAPVLVEEQSTVLKELHSLRERIDHIKEIVAMQQSYARISGVAETIPVDQLVEDAVKLNTGALLRHGVQVERQFERVPPVCTDKHKVLQILLNVIRNAKYACDGIERERKLITLRVFSPREDRVAVQVSDNGVGIPPENLTRIFSHGFSTRKEGHGFGLHSGALAAKELGGSLSAASPGPGQGATFTLELPLQHPSKT